MNVPIASVKRIAKNLNSDYHPAMHLIDPTFEGVGGTIRNRPEDFIVTEIPAYQPSGEGEHVLCEIQKIGMTTFDAIDRIARALNIHPRDIGYAGLKDANAITRQSLTIPRVTQEQVMKLQITNLTPLSAEIHHNKLRPGHLKGNAFVIKIRDVEPTKVVLLKPVLDSLNKHGMPNSFGEQRFGRRGDNDLLGAALLRGDPMGVLRQLFGRPDPRIDSKSVIKARSHFEAGDYQASMKDWPRTSGMERRLLARFIKTKSAGQAVRCIEPKLKRLWMSALQSRLFNAVVGLRKDSLGKLLVGDLAYLHDRGACFAVEDLAKEQPRADAFEISPTGPMLGYRMTLPAGEALAVEQEAYEQFGLSKETFAQAQFDTAKGDRRPLRVQPTDITLTSGIDEIGGHITVAFTLPAGSFATVLMACLMGESDEEQED